MERHYYPASVVAAETTGSQLIHHHHHHHQQRQQHPCRNHSSSAASSSRHSRLAWLGYAVVILACIASALANEQTTTAAPTTTAAAPKLPAFNPVDCKTSFDTSKHREICRDRPYLFPILTYAEGIAKRTCEEDFKNELWNCSGFSLLKEPLITKGDQVFQESAYVYALSLAVITHTVVKGCSENVLKNCSCGDKDSTEKTVCPSSVEYGLQTAETFLHQRFSSSGGGLKQQVAHHNFRAARNIIHEVLDSSGQHCRCHGVSGACTLKTCLALLPDFSVLAKKIKEVYSTSCKVAPDGGPRNNYKIECGRSISESDFIHTSTHNWCRENPEIGALGTRGRECNPLVDAPNSCSKLCCGRRSEEIEVEKVTQCKCSFTFCCEIKCQTCRDQKKFHQCT